jgi:hypothetical protein
MALLSDEFRGGTRPAPPDQIYPIASPARNHGDGSVIAESYADMTHAAEHFGRHAANVEASRDLYSPQGRQRQLQAWGSTDAAKQVDAAEQAAEKYAADAAAERDRTRAELSPEGETAHDELKAQRNWARAQRALDAAQGGNLAATAQRLIRDAQPGELGTLLEELPAYLNSRGAQSNWIAPPLQQVAPEYAAANQDAANAQRALEITRHNARVIREAVASGRRPATGTLVDPTRFDRGH